MYIDHIYWTQLRSITLLDFICSVRRLPYITNKDIVLYCIAHRVLDYIAFWKKQTSNLCLSFLLQNAKPARDWELMFEVTAHIYELMPSRIIWTEY